MVIYEQKSELTAEQPSRRERKSEETRTRIFQAAMQLFAQHGFPNVTVEQITEAADVGKGTFFNYFPTKEHILVAMAEVKKDLVASAAREAREATTVKPLILQLVTNMAQTTASRQTVLRSLLGGAFTNEVMMKHFHGVLMAARSAAVEIMKRGQELGEIRQDIPAAELGRMMQTMGFGTAVLWSLQPEQPDLQAWLTQSMEVFWQGIKAGPVIQKSSKRTEPK